MIRAFVAALRLEVVVALRMRETYTFGLIPGLVGFPLLLVGMVGFLLLRSAPTVAVPPGLGLAPGSPWSVRVVDDPAAAFARGEVDAALLSAVGAPDGTWVVEGRWRDERARGQLSEALAAPALAAFDQRVTAAGGTVAGSRRVARLAGAAAVDPAPPEDPARPVALFGTFAAVYLSCYLVPVRVASERASGVLEALAVCPTPLWVVGLARLVVVAALGLLVPTLAAGSLLVIAGPILPAPPPGTLAEVVATTLFVDAVFLAIGSVAGSSRTALGWASSALLACLAAAAVAMTAPVPWVPLVGFGAGDGVAQGARVVGLVLGVVAVGSGTVRWLRGEAVLPPAGGAA